MYNDQLVHPRVTGQVFLRLETKIKVNPAAMSTTPRTPAITSGQNRDHHPPAVSGGHPLAGHHVSYPTEYPSVMRTVPSITRAAPRVWRGSLMDLATASPQAATIMPTTKVNTFGQNVDHHPNGLAGHALAMLHPTGKTTKKLETTREAPRISSVPPTKRDALVRAGGADFTRDDSLGVLRATANARMRLATPAILINGTVGGSGGGIPPP